MSHKILAVLILSLLTSYTNVDSNAETVSLLDYTSKEQLQAYGLTPDKIVLLNQAYQESYGYSRYDNYHRQQLGSFEILINPNNPNELYVVKDGNFLLDIGENNAVKLYKKGTTLPSPQDMSIFWEPNTPAINIASEDKIYYDLNLDGVDIVSEKMPYKERNGKISYTNYTDIAIRVPSSNIMNANIANKHCEPLIDSTACCLTDDGNYQPYIFDYHKGWQVLNDNPKVTEYCNGNIKEERQRLIEAIYNDYEGKHD